MNTYKPFWILSAERPELSAEENASRTAFMGSQLINDGADIITVHGRYKTVPETAFLVLGGDLYNSQEHRDLIFRLANLYEQETVLHVDANRSAALYSSEGFFLTGLGRWHEVSEKEADKLDAVTRIGRRFWSAS